MVNHTILYHVLGTWIRWPNSDGYFNAFNAVNHPHFLAKVKLECYQNVLPIVRENMVKGNTTTGEITFKLAVVVRLKTGKNCLNWKRVMCNNVQVKRPKLSKCFAKFGQNPPKINYGHMIDFPVTNACDQVNVKEISCQEFKDGRWLIPLPVQKV